MDDDAPTGTDNVITEFENYEQFLDSQITAVDLFYLEVDDMIQNLKNRIKNEQAMEQN